MRYDTLQTTSFPITSGSLRDLLQPYVACSLPQRWQHDFANLLYPGRDNSERGIPLRYVTTAFATFVPDIIVHTGSSRGFWMGARRQPGEEVLKPLLDAGFITAARSFASRYPHFGSKLEELPGFLEKVRPQEDLEWTVAETLPLDGSVTPQMTRFLPDLIAEWLVATGFTVDHGKAGVSRFQRVTTPVGAEMVSWPPHEHPLAKSRWPWSYVLRFSVQTWPGDDVPRLVVHIGIRRYTGRKMRLKSYDRAVSVMLRAPAPWYDDDVPALFARAAMKWRPGTKGTKTGRMDWRDDIHAALTQLHGRFRLPEVADLCNDPLPFLDPLPGSGQMVNAAVLYRTGYAYKHQVGDGVSAKDRWRIFTALADHLRDHLAKEPELGRVFGVRTVDRPAPQADGVRIPTAPIAAALDNGRLVLEVWWQTRAMRDEILAALPRVLDLTPLEPDGTGAWTCVGEHLQVTVRTRELKAEIAGKLAIDANMKHKKDRIRDASRRRVRQIVDWLAPEPADGPVFAVVELDNADAFSDENDPKHAIRVGAAHAGRNTQFLIPYSQHEKDKERHTRIRSALRDLLLRQLGVSARSAVLGLDAHLLPADTRVVALWLIRKNAPHDSAYPIAVCCDPGQTVVKVRLPGNRQWLPMHRALLAMALLDGDKSLMPAEKVAAFTDDVLNALDELPGPTLLVTHAQNFRSKVKTLTNGNLELDSFATVIGEPVAPRRHRNTRHLRMRTSLNGETPQYYSYVKEAKTDEDGGEVINHLTGISAGLWAATTDHGRTFFSVPDKPATSAKSSPRGSRIEMRMKVVRDPVTRLPIYDSETGKRVMKPTLDIGSDVTNPQLVEMFVLVLQPGDHPESWAAACHQYRYVAPHFDDPTLLPYPMHSGMKAGEYLFPGSQLDDKVTGMD